MAFYCPPKYEKPVVDLNAEYYKLTGELDDKQAKLTLIKFLHQNLTCFQ